MKLVRLEKGLGHKSRILGRGGWWQRALIGLIACGSKATKFQAHFLEELEPAWNQYILEQLDIRYRNSLI